MAETALPIASRGPWAVAVTRLARDRSAMAALAVFATLLLLCFLAPVYAKWAGVDPFRSTLDAVITIDGAEIPVMEQSTED
jgi:peptide/nickel transport system permease protein